MEIGYRNSRIKKICTKRKEAAKHLASQIAPELLFQRIGEIEAFANLSEIPFQTPPLHFHPLRENHAGRFAVTVKGLYRIVLAPAGNFKKNDDGSINTKSVKQVTVYDVEDYH